MHSHTQTERPKFKNRHTHELPDTHALVPSHIHRCMGRNVQFHLFTGTPTLPRVHRSKAVDLLCAERNEKLQADVK